MFLSELTHPISRLKGMGPASIKALGTLGITTVAELLRHFPRSYENRRDPVSIRQSITTGVPANTIVRVVDHQWFGFGRQKTLKLIIQDLDNTPGALVCFNRPFFEKSAGPGSIFHLYGTFEHKYGDLQSTAFDLSPCPQPWQWGEPLPTLGKILPLYPLSAGLHQGPLQKAMAQALKEYAFGIEDELPSSIILREGFITLKEALTQIHFPSGDDTLAQARRLLIYQEFFHLQTAVLRRSFGLAVEKRPPLDLPKDLRKEFLSRLPFELTPDQKKVIEEIDSDLGSQYPMARLLQGDVGSGKTLVAFLSALPLIQKGFQCALMAPTELLALQHAENAARVLDPLGIKIAFLSGNIKASGRTMLLKELAEGRIDFVVGTHALFSSDVVYKSLRYVIIDEQHRFGVGQRQALMQKGVLPDLLLMSATPIPRTLALTAFGDLKVSVIKTMPLGRKPIETHSVKEGNQRKIYDFIREQLVQGRQAYFVYPLIEASETRDLKDAQTMYEHLKTEVFPEFNVGLIHSRVEEEAKRNTMEAFANGEIHILAATSVVEVGVDVANATCMVIEHADRFGLSALHQLRGRVGRSDLQSYCFLVFSDSLSDIGKQRLKIMKETTDGFRIAEEDLRIRGPGELTGVRQAGYLKLALADFQTDGDVLVKARTDVLEIMARDPGLASLENSSLLKLWNTCPPFKEDLTPGT